MGSDLAFPLHFHEKAELRTSFIAIPNIFSFPIRIRARVLADLASRIAVKSRIPSMFSRITSYFGQIPDPGKIFPNPVHSQLFASCQLGDVSLVMLNLNYLFSHVLSAVTLLLYTLTVKERYYNFHKTFRLKSTIYNVAVTTVLHAHSYSTLL